MRRIKNWFKVIRIDSDLENELMAHDFQDEVSTNGFLYELGLTYDHCRSPQTLNRVTWACECPAPLKKRGDDCVCIACLFNVRGKAYGENPSSEYLTPFAKELNDIRREEEDPESVGGNVLRHPKSEDLPGSWGWALRGAFQRRRSLNYRVPDAEENGQPVVEENSNAPKAGVVLSDRARLRHAKDLEILGNAQGGGREQQRCFGFLGGRGGRRAGRGTGEVEWFFDLGDDRWVFKLGWESVWGDDKSVNLWGMNLLLPGGGPAVVTAMTRSGAICDRGPILRGERGKKRRVEVIGRPTEVPNPENCCAEDIRVTTKVSRRPNRQPTR